VYARGLGAAAVAATVLWASHALAWEVVASDVRRPREFEGVGVTEHLGERVTLDLAFTDHEGHRVRLRDLVADGQPVLLTLNYYECPSVCTLQLNGLVEGLRGVDLRGEEFHVVTLSIDPQENVELASRKRETYLELLGRDDIRWEFLVGGEVPIRRLAQELGFAYRYDPRTGDYAHVPAAFLVAADGTITRYLYGLQYPARDLKFALVEAGDGQVGTTLDRILMTCFHYVDGTYAPWAFGIMRLGGMVVAVLLAIFLAVLWRREHQRRRAEATS
jgi:protein SCO1